MACSEYVGRRLVLGRTLELVAGVSDLPRIVISGNSLPRDPYEA